MTEYAFRDKSPQIKKKKKVIFRNERQMIWKGNEW